MRGKNNWERVGTFPKKIKGFIKRGGPFPWYWVYRFKWNCYPRLFRAGSFPTEIIIETSSLCNLNCIMCFRNYLDKKVRYSNMDFELFKKIIDECKQNRIAAVKLSWRGEALLNKDFVNMVKYAKEAGIKEVSTLTNATNLTSELAKGLVESGLDQLIFSVDGVTKETYEEIRRGAKFEEVMDNIEGFIKLRGTRKKPFVRIQITEIPENKGEIDAFLKMWSPKVDEIAISGFIDYSYIDEKKGPNIQEGLKNAKGRLPCPSLWQRLAIMADGTTTVCCIDLQGKLTLGNIKNKSIKSMWKSHKLNAFREVHKKRQLNSIEACRECKARITYEF